MNDYFPPRSPIDVPMATGVATPIWPLPFATRRRWTFGAPRNSKKPGGRNRRHAGVDIYAPKGSFVLAPEGGTVIASQRFVWKDRHDAILFATDSGPVILFGEVLPGSWDALGASIGSRVEAGQPVARVGVNPGGSSMLHLEMYTRGTRKNSRWYADGAPPPNLLNPTAYLKTAVAASTGDDTDVTDDDTDDADNPHDTDDQADDDNGTTHPPQTAGTSMGAGLLAVGALLLISELGDG